MTDPLVTDLAVSGVSVMVTCRVLRIARHRGGRRLAEPVILVAPHAVTKASRGESMVTRWATSPCGVGLGGYAVKLREPRVDAPWQRHY